MSPSQVLFRNSFQSGVFSIFYAIGRHPLYLWNASAPWAKKTDVKMTKTVPTQDGSINCRSNVLFFAGQVFLCLHMLSCSPFSGEKRSCAPHHGRGHWVRCPWGMRKQCEHHHCHLPWTRSTDSRQTRSCRTVIIDIQFFCRVCGFWWPGLWAFSWLGC